MRLAPLALLLGLALPSLSHAADTPAYADDLISRARELKLSQDRYWRVILHYRSRFMGLGNRWKSEIDAPAFFNSEDGRSDPEAELEATIRAFFAPLPDTVKDPDAQHPQCRFIDRYRWLKSKLAFEPARLPEQPCKHYDEWRAALDPESVTLVFSSYFMNNPSSMFGHTLLRLNHRTHSSQQRLLDYGVNYAAIPTTQNAFLYGFLGLVGGFKGDFSNIPYYLKVQEYSDHESRDLWEYDLGLDAAAIQRLMDHLWTVGRVPVSYYFLDRNCSYMLLSLLDAADPTLELTEEFQGVWVIPADTVRLVGKRAGLIRAVSMRPSLTARIRRQRAQLSGEDLDRFARLTAQVEADETRPESYTPLLAEASRLPSERSAPLIDLLLDYFKLIKVSQKGKLEPTQSKYQQAVLGARLAIDRKPADLAVSAEEIEKLRPDYGHNTRRWSLGAGYSDRHGSFGEIGYRGAFHDLSGNPRGYPSNAQIEVMQLRLRYYPDRARQWIRLERADLVSILSLSPMDALFKRMSWSARIGADPVRDFDSRLSLEYKGQVAGGASVQPIQGLLLYALGRAELGLSGAFVPRYRLGPAIVGGAHWNVAERLSLDAWASYSKPLLGFTSGYAQASAHARLGLATHWELRAQGDFSRSESQGKLAAYGYF